MKRPVVLAAAAGAAAYGPLLEALAEAGERAGWLELGATEMTVPAGLGEAAAQGVLRAVAVGAGRVATVKPIRGEAVFDDLLREHFRGCRLVLVRGGEDLPQLEPASDGWRLRPPAGPGLRQSTAELVANLRRPSFWRRFEAADSPAGD